jgi:hypothetical protein
MKMFSRLVEIMWKEVVVYCQALPRLSLEEVLEQVVSGLRLELSTSRIQSMSRYLGKRKSNPITGLDRP